MLAKEQSKALVLRVSRLIGKETLGIEMQVYKLL